MTVRIWIKEKVPEAPIYWAEMYFVEVDQMLAIPVFEYSKAAKESLERGIIRKIEASRAQELNHSFAIEGEHAVRFLDELLETRWAIISRQYQEMTAEWAGVGA